METKTDVERNMESFLQIGDFVGASFFFSSVALILTAIFILIQIKGVPDRWRVPVIISSLVPLAAGLNAFYRRSYWVSTMTDPVEFRFFDWFFTVPLMAITFYYLLKPLGAKKWMLVSLFISALCMLGFGYLGEVLYPEQSIKWGIWGSLGFAGIIGSIYAHGYPKIFRPHADIALTRGYIFLSIFLPIGWSIYPLGYMTVPGNILEGTISQEMVSVMYNIADVLNKAGLALVVYYIATHSKESKLEAYRQYAKISSNGKSSKHEEEALVKEKFN